MQACRKGDEICPQHGCWFDSAGKMEQMAREALLREIWIIVGWLR